jgi:putative ATPase
MEPPHSGDLFAAASTPSRPASAAPGAPLAERMRPASLAEIVGQDHLIGPGHLLHGLVEERRLTSMILWGPAGAGKTTLARVLAHAAGQSLVELSATSAGVKQIRETAQSAARLQQQGGVQTVLFVDEIHRFHKGQQDALLPWVESGAICLIGATTENPSFEVVPPLLSRCRLLRLEALSDDDLILVVRRALDTDAPRGLAGCGVRVPDTVLKQLAISAQGDARAALGTLELAVQVATAQRRTEVTENDLAEAQQRPFLRHGAEDHFNEISAVQKSIRNSDPDAAVYWLARLLEAGDDPMYVARRLLVTASEDIGLADPAALTLAASGVHAVHALGMPEARLVLAQVAVYLAAAPKSNSSYRAYAAAAEAVRESGSLPVPMQLRNAVTPHMRADGYGAGYESAHASEEGLSGMESLPDALRGRQFFEAVDRGAEASLGERVAAARTRRAELRSED